MNTVVTILVTILIFGLLIFIHELGHYIAARIFHVGIKEFAIGMGPAIFSRTRKNGEKFSIRVLPLGGFCAFDGEDEEASDPACFNNQKPWKRIIVLVSGAFMNFLVAMLIIINVFLFAGMYFPKINMLLPDFSTIDQVTSPLQAGDIILEINGRDMYLSNDMSVALASVKEDEKFDITVVRNGEIITIKDVVKRAYSAYQVDAETGEFVRDEDGNYVLAHDDSGNLI
ncbi:MAG: site-2 protease family protein, partial [Candidatus Woodwardiibium sp.]